MNRSSVVGLILLAGCYVPHYPHPGGPHGPACADILAARQLSSDPDRVAAFGKIAAHADLSPHEQMYLIDATLESGDFGPGEAEVLVALVKSPVFYPESRYHLSFRLQDFSSSPEKKRVVDALVDTPAKRK